MVADMDERSNMVVLSLGGNIGDVKQTFINSINLLKEEVGEIDLVSSIYKTKAWGVEDQPDFLNQVLVLNSDLNPQEVLKRCMNIELKLGRVRKQKWYERIIDIDILFYNDKIIESSNLTIPHPYVHKRNFVLFPLVDLIPTFKHPLLKDSMEELKNNCDDKLQAIKYLDDL